MTQDSQATKGSTLSETQGEPHMAPTPSRRRTWQTWLPVLFLLGFMALGFSQGWHNALTLDALIAQREALQAYLDSHYLLALLVYALAYIAIVAISLPGAGVMTILGGFLFGWLVGGTTTVLAATIGATLVFLVARSSLGSFLRAKAGPMMSKIADGFQEDAFSYLLFLRLVPIFPFWLINLAPALLGVSVKNFFFGTLIGIIPGTFAFAFIGSGLDSVIEAQRQASGCAATDANCEISLSISSLVTPELIFAFVALGVVALIPPLLKHWRGRKLA